MPRHLPTAFLAAAIACLMPLSSGAAPDAKLPNPYREVPNWAQLPTGAMWAGVISVDPAPNGDMWVFHRSDPPIVRFNRAGKVVAAFGNGMFVQAHGMTVDRDGNVWVTDAQVKDGKGNQVFKLSPDGKVLLTLGKPGLSGAGTDLFNGACDVVVAANGDVFVADGHLGNAAVHRIMKFSKSGSFIKAWGKRGSGQGEFDTPHSLAMDARGRLFVADRSNNRLQIFDQEGRFLAEWRQFGRPSGVYIDKNDTIYVADSQSNAAQNPGFTRGIRIGSAKDGTVTALIPFVEPDPDKNNNAGIEGVAADADGNVFGAEVSTERLKKYIKP